MPAYIKYRQGVVSKPTSTSTKNTPLSSVEIDGNLHSIEDAISNIESDSWVSTNRIADSQVTPSKLSTDTTGFKNKINIQTAATGSTVVAKGTTAERDSSPLEGYFRYNITLGKPEWRNATTWVVASATTDTVYVGTTPIALNRANAALNLTGVSIDGNAGTVTNGVYTTGNQTIAGDKTFNGNTTLNGTLTINNTISATGNISTSASIIANAFSGNGSSLTTLNATNLSSGTVGTDRLPYATSTNKGAVRVSVSGTTLNIWTS